MYQMYPDGVNWSAVRNFISDALDYFKDTDDCPFYNILCELYDWSCFIVDSLGK